MGKEIMTCGDNKIKKCEFHCYKYPVFLKDSDFDKILIYSKISCSRKNYKCFIGYMDDDNYKTVQYNYSKKRAHS